jgi:hypothetical protein
MPYNITNIQSNTTIGDSLSSMNSNYAVLETWVNNIQLSATNLWIPLTEFYNAYSAFFKSANTTSQQYSASWVSMSTTVETNSAKWIKPITIFYPQIFPYPFTNNNTNTVYNWLTNNFPVSGTTVTKPSYVENQQIIIYAHTYTQNVQPDTVYNLMDMAQCSTYDGNICAYCTTSYYGYVYCSNGDFSCGGSSSCSQCATVNCYYTGYPYVNLTNRGRSAQSYISAAVTMGFSERQEVKQIKAISYKVKNCNWVFDKFIN